VGGPFSDDSRESLALCLVYSVLPGKIKSMIYLVWQGEAELAKLHYRVNLWTCSACGKSFYGEVIITFLIG
jgi:hypothetical protein